MGKKKCLVVVVGIVVVIAAIVLWSIYGSRSSGKNSSDQKPPEYSFTDAVATNVSITGEATRKIFTADFTFTLNASNPNKNHTLCYGGGEVSFFVRKRSTRNPLASAVTMPASPRFRPLHLQSSCPRRAS
ncbi:unnamed protein product [Cuscuta epithymum]|uniref:Late embryogenesis abundant protein LEA-2 subgroup domain-containing protein n=1 Tax=Cuscuta epithymum TaxID=186058 RepID=A0AAV0FEN3_9ASTE|nr:unnamed protein product [Cuscuta epithymum]